MLPEPAGRDACGFTRLPSLVFNKTFSNCTITPNLQLATCIQINYIHRSLRVPGRLQSTNELNLFYVTASQSSRSRHPRRKTERAQALRAHGITQETWSVEGWGSHYGPAQDQTRSVSAHLSGHWAYPLFFFRGHDIPSALLSALKSEVPKSGGGQEPEVETALYSDSGSDFGIISGFGFRTSALCSRWHTDRKRCSDKPRLNM